MSFTDYFMRKPSTDNTSSERITKLEQTAELLKARLDSLELTNTDLRNKVLRKIQRLPANEEEEITTPMLKAGQRVRHGKA